jgi:hypothetical protein
VSRSKSTPVGTSGDEARYVKQEEKAAKRVADNDPDYENT